MFFKIEVLALRFYGPISPTTLSKLDQSCKISILTNIKDQFTLKLGWICSHNNNIVVEYVINKKLGDKISILTKLKDKIIKCTLRYIRSNIE